MNKKNKPTNRARAQVELFAQALHAAAAAISAAKNTPQMTSCLCTQLALVAAHLELLIANGVLTEAGLDAVQETACAEKERIKEHIEKV